jgi:hypothetical protein
VKWGCEVGSKGWGLRVHARTVAAHVPPPDLKSELSATRRQRGVPVESSRAALHRRLRDYKSRSCSWPLRGGRRRQYCCLHRRLVRRGAMDARGLAHCERSGAALTLSIGPIADRLGSYRLCTMWFLARSLSLYYYHIIVTV